MANEKISELPPGQPAQSGDLFGVARTGASTNYALAVSDIANYIGTRGGIAVVPGGNTSGGTAVISSGTLNLIGGTNVLLGQTGQTIAINAGGIYASVGGNNTAGTPAVIPSGTLFLAGGNNVTLSQNSNSVTISANTAVTVPMVLPISGGTTSGTFTGLTFGNANNVSAGLNNGTVTFTASQSVQTQASGAIARTGFSTATTTGTALVGTLNTVGLSLGVPAYLTTQSVQFDVSLGGNTSGALGLISSGTLFLAGGNNVTLSQNGNSVTVSAGLMGQSTQTQASGAIAGTGFTSASTAGTSLVGTLSTGGLSLGIPNFLTTQSVQTQASGALAGTGFTTGPTVGTAIVGTMNTAGLSIGVPPFLTTQSVQTQSRFNASIIGNVSGTPAVVSSGTLFLAGGNNVTLSQAGNSVTISANTVAAATLSVSAGTTSGAFAGITLANSNNVSWGLNNGTITATFGLTAGQSVQTQASGAIAGTGFTSATTAGTALVGTLNTVGLSLGIPAFLTTQSAQTGLAGIGFTTGPTVGTALLGTLDTNGLSLGVPAYITTQSLQTQGLNSVSIGGQVTGTPALITAGTLVLAGGNNITLSQNSNTITISAGGVLSVSAAGSSGTFGALTFSNLNNVTFGLVNGTITASAALTGGQSVQTQASGNIAATGFATTTTNGSVIVGTNNTTGFTLAVPPYLTTQSNQTQGGYAAGNTTYASSATFDPRSQSTYGSGIITVGFTNGSNVIFATQSAQTEGRYAVGNTTGGNGSSTFDARSLSVSGGGNVYVGFSNGALLVSGVGGGGGVTSGAAYIAGATTGQTSSTYALSSLNMSFAGGLVSGGWSNGTLLVSAPGTLALSQSLFATGNTVLTSYGSASFGSLLFSGVGGAAVGVSSGAVVISAPPVTPLSRLIWPVGEQLTAVSAPAQGAISVQYVAPQWPVTASRLDALVSWAQGSGANASTAGVILSAYAGVYTRNGSTLSSLSTGSTQTTYTYASNNSGNTQLLAGAIRPVSVPINVSMSPGEYFVAFNFSTNSTGGTNYGQTLSMMGGNNLQTGSNANYAEFTNATASTTNLFGGMGLYSATAVGIPASMALSRIVQTGASLAQANIALVFRNV